MAKSPEINMYMLLFDNSDIIRVIFFPNLYFSVLLIFKMFFKRKIS